MKNWKAECDRPGVWCWHKACVLVASGACWISEGCETEIKMDRSLQTPLKPNPRTSTMALRKCVYLWIGTKNKKTLTVYNLQSRESSGIVLCLCLCHLFEHLWVGLWGFRTRRRWPKLIKPTSSMYFYFQNSIICYNSWWMYGRLYQTTHTSCYSLSF